MSNTKYWNLSAKKDSSKEADLYLYNIIDDYAYEGFSDSADSILKDINDLGDIEQLNVFINSPGGSVFEGISIKNMLERQKLKGCFINVVIDGLAASIASVIAMAGDKVSMPENALMMIHRASCGCCGNADDMRKQIEVLDKIDKVITNTYVSRSGGILTEERIKEMFDSGDTWLTAEEAKNYGLCDEITESLKVAACAKTVDFENNSDLKCTNVDIYKWADKVDEWIGTSVDNTIQNKEGIEPMENNPINLTVNLDVKAIADLLEPIVKQINDLGEKLNNMAAVATQTITMESSETVNEPVEPAEPEVEPAEPDEPVNKTVNEPEVETTEPVITNKVNIELNPDAFDNYLKNLK